MTTQISLVAGVDFVCVPTSDLAGAMDFYGNMLGLPRSSVWQRPGEEPVGAERQRACPSPPLRATPGRGQRVKDDGGS